MMHIFAIVDHSTNESNEEAHIALNSLIQGTKIYETFNMKSIRK